MASERDAMNENAHSLTAHDADRTAEMQPLPW